MYDLDLEKTCHFCGKSRKHWHIDSQAIKTEEVQEGIHKGMTATVNTLEWCNDSKECMDKAKDWLKSGNEELPEPPTDN